MFLRDRAFKLSHRPVDTQTSIQQVCGIICGFENSLLIRTDGISTKSFSFRPLPYCMMILSVSMFLWFTVLQHRSNFDEPSLHPVRKNGGQIASWIVPALMLMSIVLAKAYILQKPPARSIMANRPSVLLLGLCEGLIAQPTLELGTAALTRGVYFRY